MTIEEIKTEMKQLETKVKQLGRELELAENKQKSAEVPETLNWKNGDTYYYLTAYGIVASHYEDKFDNNVARNHIIFPTEELVEMFREKAQFIADLLHFKWLYDKDYVPDWNNKNSQKWHIYYDSSYCEYDACCCFTYKENVIYFSSEKIAKKCADWLNSRNTRNEND